MKNKRVDLDQDFSNLLPGTRVANSKILGAFRCSYDWVDGEIGRKVFLLTQERGREWVDHIKKERRKQ